jgi:protein SCO1/2
MNTFIARRDALKTIAGALGAVACAGLLAACSPGKPSFRGIDITGADYARDFHLTDFNGQPRQLADFKGKAVLLFFGYTQCPDVCPTTLSDMVQVKQKLGTDGQRLQVLFVSIDPERDTPELLRAYLGSFDSTFLGLYAGAPDKLAALAKDFKVFYEKVQGKTPGSYSMNHSAASYIYDPQGRLRLFSRYGMPADAVADDVRLLLQGA